MCHVEGTLNSAHSLAATCMICTFMSIYWNLKQLGVQEKKLDGRNGALHEVIYPQQVFSVDKLHYLEIFHFVQEVHIRVVWPLEHCLERVVAFDRDTNEKISHLDQ